MKKYIISLVVAVLVFVGITYALTPSTSTRFGGTTNLDAIALDSTLTVGTSATIGTTATIPNALLASSTFTGVLSTSTPASLTLQGSDLNYSSILMLPTVGAITVTLPATTSLPSTFVPTAGYVTRVLITNASTTASQTITIAGGTGTLLKKATTTSAIAPGTTGELIFVRKTNTDIVTTFDTGI